jgi:hypothetical protein
MFRFRLRTLMIVLAIGPPVLGGGAFYARWLAARNDVMAKSLLLTQAEEKQGRKNVGSRPSCGVWQIAELVKQHGATAANEDVVK